MNRNRILKAILPYKFLWLFCCIFLIVDLIAFAAITNNHQNRIDELQREYTTSRENNTRLAEKNIVMRQYVKTDEELQLFRETLPEMAMVTDQARILDEAVERYGLFVNKMSFKPEDSKPLSLWKYTTSFTVTGRYKKLKAFLTDIQGLPGLFCIEGLSLKRPDNSELVNMTLHIATYCK